MPARWDVDGDAVLDIDEFRNLWHELSVAAYLPPQPPGYEGRAPLSVTVLPSLPGDMHMHMLMCTGMGMGMGMAMGMGMGMGMGTHMGVGECMPIGAGCACACPCACACIGGAQAVRGADWRYLRARGYRRQRCARH